MAYIFNKKAGFNYEIQERLEAGIELFGHETKSIRAGHGNLEGSFIRIKSGEAYLIGALISPYQTLNTPVSYDERRDRRLLLHKKEIKRLSELGTGNGLTVIPISLYNKSNKIKLELAIAKGKKKHDKRQVINKRESDREISRVYKSRR